MKYADLHLHTTASDGTKTPSQLVAVAIEKGFSVIAITDHDTTGGLEEALNAGAKLNLEIIPGIELSTLDGERELHILGYYPDYHNQRLQEILIKIIKARQTRAIKMVSKLIELGLDLNLGRVCEIAGSEFIGRPHIAQALLEKKYISNLEEAFTEDYIGRGGRAYVERFKLSPGEGIELLKQAGAVPVLAHPGHLSSGPPLSEEEVVPLISGGLRGIEAYYSKHSPEREEYYRRIAEKHNLLITGGSDCHGQVGADNCLGSIKLPYHYVEALKYVHQQKSIPGH